MKYSNSLKYMNSFPAAEEVGSISQKRALELCNSLGRINAGMRCICVPECSAGHAVAVLLEAVIKSAGHCVGRISSAGGFDSRSSIFIDGEIAQIEDYNRAVAELKSVVQKMPGEVFTKEETAFALGLLLCRISGCEYVILEGLSGKDFSLDAICAPYDLIVMPTVYGSEGASDKIRVLCDSIRRGTREVVSGNQKSEVYNTISNACAVSGVRLYIPVKAQFEVNEVTSRKMVFSYCGREGFMLRSPSYILRDCVMTVIESSLALRRGGVRIPWHCIMAGLSSVSDTLCFDMLSVSPLMIIDSASETEEVKLVQKTAEEVFGVGALSEAVICVPAESLKLLGVFKGEKPTEAVVVSSETSPLEEGIVNCSSVKSAAREIFARWKDRRDVVCIGSVKFALEIKAELGKLMNG